jgi:glycosyltransferase involved in cell wall biosynthesis
VRRLAIVISFSGEGGVERMVLNLVGGMAACGVNIDLLAIRAESAHLGALPNGVRLVDLGVRHSALAVPSLVRYLRREGPDAVLAAKDRAIRAAALARRLSGWRGPLVGRLGTNLTASLEGRSPLARLMRLAPMPLLYRGIDRIVAVSHGVAEDVRRTTKVPAARIAVVRNPVVTPRLAELAAAACPHPWLEDGGDPVILGAGRFTRQKDFATLVLAVARLNADRPVRLVILGEGRLRESLQSLAAELGVADRLLLPGFDPNPYAWMARANLFALSSRWEGLGSVLVEAMAVGTAVVSTDCPSGPREVLADGRFGPLVPVGDVVALAAAMGATLDDPLPAAVLREAVSQYTVEAATRAYLSVLGLADP